VVLPVAVVASCPLPDALVVPLDPLVWACTPNALNMAATVATVSSLFNTLLFCMMLSCSKLWWGLRARPAPRTPVHFDNGDVLRVLKQHAARLCFYRRGDQYQPHNIEADGSVALPFFH
jgi:hypothetical protein